MDGDGGCRLQVCGPLYLCVHGDDRTSRVPVGQARVLLVHLVLTRDAPQARARLVGALWSGDPPAHAERDVTALLSRLRSVLGPDVLPPGGDVRLLLPAHAVVDREVAHAAIERAEHALAEGDWSAAWAAGRTAMAIARRGFLPGVDLPWVERERERLRDVLLRSYEAVGEAGLGLGGPEVPTARRLAAELIAEEPMRESGYRLAMRAAVAHGDEAEALTVYAGLRQRLADELGVDPGPQSRALFEEVLLRSAGDVRR